MRRSNTFTCVLFLLFIATMAAFALLHLPEISRDVRAGWSAQAGENPSFFDKAEYVTTEGEAMLNRSFEPLRGFIELYGGVQRLLGKRVVEDSGGYPVVLMDAGDLTFLSVPGLSPFPGEDYYAAAEQNARALSALSRRLSLNDIPLLFLQAPSKIDGEDKGLPTGVYDWSNEFSDRFLLILEEESVPYIDFRPVLKEAGEYRDFFFRTDHHWKPEGALVSFFSLCAHLRSDYGLAIPSEADDPAGYETVVYKDWFLGSQGKRVGTLFAGVDDISLIRPRFATALTFEAPSSGILREGAFDETVLFPERMAEKDYYGGNPYTLYAGGDYPLTRIYNHNNPGGPRVLFIRDSFACAITPFLSLACSQLDLIDLRYFEGNAASYAEETQPDLVLVLYSPGTDLLSHMFAFEE